jgi:branched-chain amino acid transport system substrate-binding protein
MLGCTSPAADTRDELRIGLLLPYTGRDGSAGANYERGVLMAVDEVNAAGGLYGKPLRIAYADTHSDAERGLAGAKQLLARGVVAVIGPEDDELEATVSEELASASVPLLTPSSSSVPEQDSDTSLWFRLAPSDRDLGTALGRQIRASGVERVALVHTAATYEVNFANGARDRLLGANVAIELEETIQPEAADFSETIRQIVAARPDAIVLAADAVTASRFVNDFGFLAGTLDVVWYLSPSLESAGFVLNSLPSLVEGMVGISPAVSPDAARTEAFRAAFARRFKGATPPSGAYYYYDAVAVFAIAFEGAASGDMSASPAPELLREHILSASGQSGLVVAWNEIGKGIARARAGQAVYYSGVTGVVGLDKTGARSASYTRLWTVRAGAIVPFEP